MGNSDLEDGLKELDKLTQEEVWMAQAEQLKVTHSVDEKVTDVDKGVKAIDETVKGIEGEVRNARSDMQGVGIKIEGVEESVQAVQDDVKDVGSTVRIVGSDIKDISSKFRDVDNNVDQVNRSYYLNPSSYSESSDGFTGNQLRDKILRWLSAPVPSINHNIARKAHHGDTSQWFFQGEIFNQWKSSGSLLWIHGKRALLLTFNMRWSLIIYIYSRFRKNCALVRLTSTSYHCKTDLINLAPRS
jgi:hypothetical protein